MNINLEWYRIFYVVASNGNITASAKELSISQPAISKTIKNLESQLGGTLFVRTKRGVVLTNEGKEFYQYIKQAMEYINNAEHKFTDLIHLETGSITIGSSTTLTKEFLLPYLKKFHETYPHIKIQITTNTPGALFSKLRNGLIDLMILNLPTRVEQDIELIPCKKIQDCFVVNNQYLDLTTKPISLHDLYQYPLITQMKGSNTRAFLDSFCLRHAITLEPSMNLSSYGLVVEFAKRGFGIGYVTKDYIKKELKEKTLFELDINPKLPSRHIGLALSKNHIPSFSTKKLTEIVMNESM